LYTFTVEVRDSGDPEEIVTASLSIPVMQNISGPVGGGEGYSHTLDESDCDITVDDREGLLCALQASEGCTERYGVICVEDHAEIDMTGEKDIEIPGGTILAGGRGNPGNRCTDVEGERQGCLLFKRDRDPATLFRVMEPGVRITGLRLQGPGPYFEDDYLVRDDIHYLKEDRRNSGSRGILAESNIEVDNCEVFEWNYAGIYVKDVSGGQPHIHHNEIHDCKGPLGYGIEVNNAEPLIEYNKLNDCRHAVAGHAAAGTCYEAAYNEVGSGVTAYYDYTSQVGYGNIFDMHGSLGSSSNRGPAGDWVLIHHNTVTWTLGCAVDVRGQPRQIGEVFDNMFSHEDIHRAVKQNEPYGNMYARFNQVRCGTPACERQCTWDPRLNECPE